VSDGGSTDRTVEIAQEFGAKVIQMGANRSAQRNAAAERATGSYVLFIDSDMRLDKNVTAECVAKMRDDVSALVIPEIFVGEGFWAKVRGFERTFYDDVWYLEAARFYRSEQIAQLGGFDVRLVGPEDWDLDERIRSFGLVERIVSPIYHFEGDTSLISLLRKKAHYSNSFPLFTQLHPGRAALALSLERRFGLFIQRSQKLARRPLLALGLVILGSTEILVSRTSFGNRLKRLHSQERAFD